MTVRRRRAFTLVELLVVIGIIAVLIAILIPVASKMRLVAQTAATRNQCQKISGAIASYFHEYNAYPGALPNSAFVTGPGAFFQNPASGNFGNYTQSEDLVMALMGGLNFTIVGGQVKLTFSESEVRLGPVSFNPVSVTSGRKTAFTDRLADELPPVVGTTMQRVNQVTDWAQGFVQDSMAPEYMDRYSRPRPILYMRANSGGLNDTAHVIRDSTVEAPVNGFTPTFHYDFACIKSYLDLSAADKDFYGLHDPPTAAGAVKQVSANATVQAYFTAPSGNTAINAGSYLLISAGQDRVFGTADDIIVGGGGGQ